MTGLPTATAACTRTTDDAVMQASPTRKSTHLPELDGIRGIAVTMVLLYHGFSYVMQNESWTGLSRWVELATRPGWMGVDLFFVLSGFLITGILLDSLGNPHYFRNFYARRALRILPLYYLILILIGIFYRGSRGYLGLSVFYLSNMAPIFGVAVLYGPLWSLSVEEHFYLLWPWLISRLKAHRVWLLAAVICAAEPVLRAFAFFRGWDVSSYSWFRFDSLASGALLATFTRSGYYSPKRLFGLGVICVAAAGILSAGGLRYGIYTRKALAGDALLYTLCSMVFAGVIAFALSGRLHWLRCLVRWGALRRCGDLSYCLYIIHWLIFHGWDSIFGEYPYWLVSSVGQLGALCARALTVYIICFLLAEVSSRYFEGPLLRLKRLFAYG